MEKKKSQVRSVVFKKEFTNSYGTSYIFDVVFENEDAGQFFSKEKDQKTFRQGVEVEYTIEQKVNGQYTNYTVKPFQANGQAGGFPKGNPSYEHKRTALKCATELVCHGKLDEKQLIPAAEKFMTFLNA